MGKIKSRQDHFGIGNKASADSKLNLMSIHLDTLFERGVNFKTRTITIDGEVDESYFNLVDSAISEMESQNRKSITVNINSEGGSVYQAMAIVGRLRESKCKIITKGYGCIMSAATLILACGDERKISRYSWFMHHVSTYGVEGDHIQIRNAVTQAEREELAWSKWMEEFSLKPKDFWYDGKKNEDLYLTPKQLLDLGVVDSIF